MAPQAVFAEWPPLANPPPTTTCRVDWPAGGRHTAGMMRSRFPVARVSALAALVVGSLLVTQRATGPHWRTLRPGVEFATLRGEPYHRAAR